MSILRVFMLLQVDYRPKARVARRDSKEIESRGLIFASEFLCRALGRFVFFSNVSVFPFVVKET